MFDQKAADLLCSVAGRLDATGRHYMAASYWFRSKHANGFELFAKNEAKERWHYSGKLYRYASDRGFQPMIQAVPVIQSNSWAGMDNVIGELKKHDESTVQIISNVVSQLMSHKAISASVYLSKIDTYFQKDLKEIQRVADHMGTNSVLTGLNDSLYAEYNRSECTCGKK